MIKCILNNCVIILSGISRRQFSGDFMELQSYQMRTWAEIDLSALAHNFRALRSLTKEGTLFCCVVKANGYGHGAVEISRIYELLGADFLAVSNVEEALQLRDGGIRANILVLGYTPPEAAPYLARYNISQCVMSLEYARLLSLCAEEAHLKVKIHVKLDTGMGRIGFYAKGDSEKRSRALDEIAEVCSLPGLDAEGIFSHLSSSDEGDSGDGYTADQRAFFESVVSDLKARGISFGIKHLGASAALLDHPECALDMLRVGIAIFGVLPSPDIRRKCPELRPTMKLKTVVIQVKDLPEGEFVNYGRTYSASTEKKLATIPIGYADGLHRCASENGAYVEIRGERAPIVGRVCMDQCVIDVTGIDGVSLGDEVTVFGGITSVEKLADSCRTIPYEIFCSLSQRIPRVYLSGGEIVSVTDYIIN